MIFFCYFAVEIVRIVNLVIDIGNTAAKIVVFDKGQPTDVRRCSNCSLEPLEELCHLYPIERGIISSVISLTDDVQTSLKCLPFPMIYFNHQTPVPIANLYQTPWTLGTDRLAAVVGANYIKPQHDLLVIDAGTCITYDFIDEKGQYWGGNISPGKQMRFKALHTFTGKLPEVSDTGEIPIYGQSTETAIRAGVIHGIELEINGYIAQFIKKYPKLLVFLTGGDDFSFDTNLKSLIFADGLLVPKGLNRILEYNDKT